MTDKTRIKIAAVVTALFLAGISAAGLAAGHDQPQAAATTTAQPSASTPATAAGLDQSAPTEERGSDEGHEADDESSKEQEDDE